MFAANLAALSSPCRQKLFKFEKRFAIYQDGKPSTVIRRMHRFLHQRLTARKGRKSSTCIPATSGFAKC